MKYQPGYALVLTLSHETGQGTVSVGQFDWGGLLLKVTEEFKGTLSLVGNQAKSVKV